MIPRDEPTAAEVERLAEEIVADLNATLDAAEHDNPFGDGPDYPRPGRAEMMQDAREQARRILSQK
ncbi:hypothetical protein [Streptomyces salyersiae]|uniref:Uncharacterized protein n=1 Tax=Streptomyces salyersiae TaxID=3075530 RepID=A0ABU2RVC8_9ACTN|nr:hypothetical protein [Streptomyces sp. DSM 41770]MDT0432788.1 hypothetical protein [Streptomyces sp. DSM 41770]